MHRGFHNLCFGIVAAFCIWLTVAGCTEKQPRRTAQDVAATLPRHTAKAYQFPPLKHADEFEATEVKADLDCAINKGRNVVYCATGEKFSEVFGVGAAGSTESPKSNERNAQPIALNGAADSGYFAIAGPPDNILKSLGESFPIGSAVLDEIETDSPIALVYLRKSLPFFESFERLTEPINFHSENVEHRVAGFGWEEFAYDSLLARLQRDQITILDDASDDDFVIRLNTESKSDELILAKVPPLESLQATIDNVQERVQNSRLDGDERGNLQDGETFMVPIINVNMKKVFDSEPLVVQLIQFRLDEKGAELESACYAAALNDRVRSRRFIFDRPFLLYLTKRQNDQPYFAIWIGNSELLEETD